jgi:error-prone DNA polymerase
VSEIKRTSNLSLDLDGIPLDDEKTFELIQSTKTLGLFQIESPGQRELVGKFAPQSFTDLIIDISLFRPGPVKSDMITPFLNARQGWKAREIFHPDLLEILDDTEGVVVFHEQVIEIIAKLGGVTLAQADEKRRALGDKEGQQEVCDWFFPAATARGYSLEIVTKMWEVLRAFASFGFCKAHAAAFALPTYQSAWLKAHYPAAFLAGVLTHDPGMYPKRLILDEARRFGVKIEKLDINKSDRSYRVENDSSIRLALADVSGISDGEIDAILSNRPFVDLADFVHRSGVSRPTCEALLMIGAFDALYPDTLNHRDLLLHLNDLYKWSRTSSKALLNLSGSQLTFGFTPELSKTGLPDLRAHEQVRNEIEFLGMDVSHHMMEFYAEFLNQIGAVKSSDLIKQRSNSSVLVAGVKVILQTPPIRSGKRVIFVTLDDGNGCSDATFFEDAQRSYAETLYNSKLLLVRGNLRRTGARGVSIRATGAWDLSAAYEKWRNLALCE